MPTINGHMHQIIKELRPGGTCRAISSKFGTQLIVAKLYRNAASAANDNAKLNRAREAVGGNLEHNFRRHWSCVADGS